MFIAFFCASIPDRCGAFYSDLCLARELQSRGHSIILIDASGVGRNFAGGDYEGLRWKPYISAGKELDQTHLWIAPHYPYAHLIRRLNAGYRRPIIFTLHFAGAIDLFQLRQPVTWQETFWYVNPDIPTIVLNNRFPSHVVHHEYRHPFVDASPIRLSQDDERGPYITLINANMNKGLAVFLKIAKALPTHKFLAIKSYYHPPSDPSLEVPPNIVWEEFTRDTKSIYKRTRILLVPSAYESFCIVAVEAMVNGIPVLYSKPDEANTAIGMVGNTRGMEHWISPEGYPCARNSVEDWVKVIQELDDPDTYQLSSDASRQKGEQMVGTAKNAADVAIQFASRSSVQTNTQFTIQNQAPKTEAHVAGPTMAQLTQRPSQPVGWRGGKLSFARR